ncbi:hypothetical protein AX16_006268 [Volvariella volvacea WC 439]|nr:hypothetical protein AX16_006268 [Volvariella volvacea WC 439]
MLPTILEPIAHRLENLKLSLPLQELRAISNILSSSLPSLRSLTLGKGTNDDEYFVNVDQLPLSFSPPLTFSKHPNVSLVQIGPGIMECITKERLMESLPASLSHLTLWDVQPTMALEVLPSLHNLQSLNVEAGSSIDIWDPDLLLPTAATPSSYPSLARLIIDFESDGFGPLLHIIAFPCLTHLILSKMDDATIIFEALGSIAPPLEYLALKDVTATSEEVARCFGQIDTITSLAIDDGDFIDRNLVSALTLVPDQQTQILPHLKAITLRSRDLRFRLMADTTPQATYNEVAEFISSRWGGAIEGCSQIENVEIVLMNQTLGIDAYKRIIAMEVEGLVVSIHGIFGGSLVAPHPREM